MGCICSATVTAPHTGSLDTEFSGKYQGFGVLRVSLQCLADTRQMHVGVPLYREHKVLVHLVAVPAAAIMWCNLVVPAQFCQSLRCQVCHRHSAPPVISTPSAYASSTVHSQRNLGFVGCLSTRGRPQLGRFHVPPPALPTHLAPAARRLAPPSSGSV